MTEMLDIVVAKFDEALWDKRFSESQDALSKLAAETRAERASGNTTELDRTSP